jgi:hypothetical protein
VNRELVNGFLACYQCFCNYTFKESTEETIREEPPKTGLEMKREFHATSPSYSGKTYEKPSYIQTRQTQCTVIRKVPETIILEVGTVEDILCDRRDF